MSSSSDEVQIFGGEFAVDAGGKGWAYGEGYHPYLGDPDAVAGAQLILTITAEPTPGLAMLLPVELSFYTANGDDYQMSFNGPVTVGTSGIGRKTFDYPPAEAVATWARPRAAGKLAAGSMYLSLSDAPFSVTTRVTFRATLTFWVRRQLSMAGEWRLAGAALAAAEAAERDAAADRRREMAHPSQPIWRSGAFAGLFADSHLTHTELEGGDPGAAYAAVAERLAAGLLGGGADAGFARLLQGGDEAEAAGSDRNALSPEQVAAGVSAIVDGLRTAGRIASAGDLEQSVRIALEALGSLPVNGFTMLPGGWATPLGGHAITHVIIREADDEASSGSGAGRADAAAAQLSARRFTFATCNTQGAPFHAEAVAAVPVPVTASMSSGGEEGSGAGAAAASGEEGSSAAATTRIGGVKTVAQAGMALYGVPGWRLLDPSFLFALLRLAVIPQKTNGPGAVYSVLLPYLANDDPAAALDAACATERMGEWETPQRSGFCFMRCVLSSVRYAARRALRWPSAAVKRLMLTNRLCFLNAARAQLEFAVVVAAARTAGGSSGAAGGAGAMPSDDRLALAQAVPPVSSDLTLVALAVKQAARAAAKAAVRGHIGEAGFAAADAAIRAAHAQVIATAAALHLDAAGLPGTSASSEDLPSALSLSAADAVIPADATAWPGWEMAARAGCWDASAFGAKTAAADIPLPFLPPAASAVDAAKGGDSSWDAMRVATALRNLAASCDSLRAQPSPLGSGFGGSQHMLVIACVETAVFDDIPAPRAAAGGDEASADGSDAWNQRPAPEPFTAEVQTALLEDVRLVLSHYIAALSSTWVREAGGASAALAVCSLLMIADAAVRVAAADGAQPLTQVLGTRRHGIHVPLGLLRGALATRLLPCPGTRRARAAIASYAEALNSASSFVPLADPAQAPAQRTFERSCRGVGPDGRTEHTLALERSQLGALQWVREYVAAAGSAGLAGAGGMPRCLERSLRRAMADSMGPGDAEAAWRDDIDLGDGDGAGGGDDVYAGAGDGEGAGGAGAGAKLPSLMMTAGWLAERADHLGLPHAAFAAYRDILFGVMLALHPPEGNDNGAVGPGVPQRDGRSEHAADAFQLSQLALEVMPGWLNPVPHAPTSVSLDACFKAPGLNPWRRNGSDAWPRPGAGVVSDTAGLSEASTTVAGLRSDASVHDSSLDSEIAAAERRRRGVAGQAGAGPTAGSSASARGVEGGAGASSSAADAAGAAAAPPLEALRAGGVTFLDPSATEESLLEESAANAAPDYGGTLSDQEAADLACMLSAPYLRPATVLAFFAQRPGVLLQPALRLIASHALFDPRGMGPGQAAAAAAAGASASDGASSVHGWLTDTIGPLAAVPVHPAARDSTLGAPSGLLELELRCAPAPIMRPFLDLLAALTERAAAAGDNAYSPHAAALLWALRCGSYLEASALQVIDDGRRTPLPERAASELPLLLAELQASLRGPGAAAVQRWIAAADRAQDVALATALHAHVVLLWAHAQPAESGVTASGSHEWVSCGFTQLLTSAMHVAVWQRSCTTRVAMLGASHAASAADAASPAAAGADAAGVGTKGQAPSSPFMMAANAPSLLSSPVAVVLGNAPLQAALLAAVRRRDALSLWLADAESRLATVSAGAGAAAMRATASDVVLTHCARACLPGLFAPADGAGGSGANARAGAGAIARFERDADTGRYDTAECGGWSVLFPVAVLANGKAVSTLPTAIASHSDFHSLLESQRGRAGPKAPLGAEDAVPQSEGKGGSSSTAGSEAALAGSLAAKIVRVDGESGWAQVTVGGISYDVMHWTPLHAQSREVPAPQSSAGDVSIDSDSDADPLTCVPGGWRPVTADAFQSHGFPRWLQRDAAGAAAAAAASSPDYSIAGRPGQVLSFGGVAYSRLYRPGVGMLGSAGALLDVALHSGQRVYLLGDPAFAAPHASGEAGHVSASALPTPPKDLPTLIALMPEAAGAAGAAGSLAPGGAMRLLLWLSPAARAASSTASDDAAAAGSSDAPPSSKPSSDSGGTADAAATGKVAPQFCLGAFFIADVSAADATASIGRREASLQVYRLADLGRVTQASLVYSSDVRCSLRALDADVRPRAAPAPPGSDCAGGDALGGALPPFREPNASHRKFLQRVAQENAAAADHSADHGLGSEVGLDPQLDAVSGIAAAAADASSQLDLLVDGSASSRQSGAAAREQGSLTVQRTVTITSGGGAPIQYRETLLPARFALGLIPEALLASFELWVRHPAVPLLAVAGSAAVAARRDANDHAVIVGYPRSSNSSFAGGQSRDAVAAFRGLETGVAEADLLRVEVDRRTGIARVAGPRNALPDDGAVARSHLAAASALLRVPKRDLALDNHCTLVSVSSAPPQSPLGRVFALLSRVEAASHMLVWGRAARTSAGRAVGGGRVELPRSVMLLERIELPRLQLSFDAISNPAPAAPGKASDPAGWRLQLQAREVPGFCLRHASSAGADSRSAVGTIPMIASLCSGLPFSLLLEECAASGSGAGSGGSGRLQLLLPTYDIRCPAVQRLPFEASPRPVHRGAWCRTFARARILALPVHPSGAMLTYADATAALCHVRLLLATRRYDAAAHILHIYALDGQPTPEQLHLLHGIFARGDDCHPDAIALRLRLQVMLLRAAASLARGGTPAAQGLISASAARQAAAASCSPLGMLGLGNGDPWGVAWAAWKAWVHPPWLAQPSTFMVEDVPVGRVDGVPQASPFTCPLAAYSAYVLRLPHVAPAARLEAAEETVLQAIVTVVARESYGGTLPLSIRVRDQWLAAEADGAAAEGGERWAANGRLLLTGAETEAPLSTATNLLAAQAWREVDTDAYFDSSRTDREGRPIGARAPQLSMKAAGSSRSAASASDVSAGCPSLVASLARLRLMEAHPIRDEAEESDAMVLRPGIAAMLHLIAGDPAAAVALGPDASAVSSLSFAVLSDEGATAAGTGVAARGSGRSRAAARGTGGASLLSLPPTDSLSTLGVLLARDYCFRATTEAAHPAFSAPAGVVGLLYAAAWLADRQRLARYGSDDKSHASDDALVTGRSAAALVALPALVRAAAEVDGGASLQPCLQSLLRVCGLSKPRDVPAGAGSAGVAEHALWTAQHSSVRAAWPGAWDGLPTLAGQPAALETPRALRGGGGGLSIAAVYALGAHVSRPRPKAADTRCGESTIMMTPQEAAEACWPLISLANPAAARGAAASAGASTALSRLARAAPTASAHDDASAAGASSVAAAGCGTTFTGRFRFGQRVWTKLRAALVLRAARVAPSAAGSAPAAAAQGGFAGAAASVSERTRLSRLSAAAPSSGGGATPGMPVALTAIVSTLRNHPLARTPAGSDVIARLEDAATVLTPAAAGGAGASASKPLALTGAGLSPSFSREPMLLPQVAATQPATAQCLLPSGGSVGAAVDSAAKALAAGTGSGGASAVAAAAAVLHALQLEIATMRASVAAVRDSFTSRAFAVATQLQAMSEASESSSLSWDMQPAALLRAVGVTGRASLLSTVAASLSSSGAADLTVSDPAFLLAAAAAPPSGHAGTASEAVSDAAKRKAADAIGLSMKWAVLQVNAGHCTATLQTLDLAWQATNDALAALSPPDEVSSLGSVKATIGAAAGAVKRAQQAAAACRASAALAAAVTAVVGQVNARRWHAQPLVASSTRGVRSAGAASAAHEADAGATVPVLLEPRYAYMEMLLCSLLREGQVRLLADFRAARAEGRNVAQQMLMGMGKSLVISPLLVLLWGDGATAVTLVTPAPLLRQGVAAVRSAICNAVLDIPARVLTIDRAFGKGDASQPAASTGGGGDGAGDESDQLTVAAVGSTVAVPACLQQWTRRNVLQTTAAVLGTSAAALARRDQPLSWPIPGSQQAAAAAEARALLRSMIEVRSAGGALLATPETCKSLLLAYVDLLAGESRIESQISSSASAGAGSSGGDAGADDDDDGDGDGGDSDARAARLLNRQHAVGTCADAVGGVLRFLRARDDSTPGDCSAAPSAPSSVAIIDELDSVLHPLRSALNYPTGPRMPLPIGAPRWRLALHLVQVTVAAARVAAVAATAHDVDRHVAALHSLCGGSTARAACDSLVSALRAGAASSGLLLAPELLVLQAPLYASTLAQPLAGVALSWLERCPDLLVGDDMRSWRRRLGAAAGSAGSRGAADAATRQVAVYIASPPSASLAARKDAELDVASITAALRPDSIAAINLAQRLVTAILPHALSKQVDVHYGLLRFDLSGRECPDTHRREPLGRRLLAVPFTARFQPSLAADFADADVRAVNTCLAYAYNGMRPADVREWAASLQNQMRRETGPVAGRPTAVAFADALRAAGELADASGDAGGAVAAASVPPLDLLALGDSAALLALHRAVGRLPHVTASWLDSAFERTHRAEELQLAASGHDIGADAIFGQRLGFTGTPNSLVPLSLLPVRYDRGEEATTLRVLASPDCVSVAAMGRDWSTLRILQWAADCILPSSGTAAAVPFTALIDAGALITQLSNREVAAALLVFGCWAGRPWHCDGVTYLDERGEKYVLEKPPGWLPAGAASATSAGARSASGAGGAGGAAGLALPETVPALRAVPAFQALLAAPAVPLSRSGASARFVFFDHVHTTGTDVPMPPDAIGACTLGAANTYRDFAQAAWRLRRLGKGQTLHVLLVHEIASLARKTVAELLSSVPAAAGELTPSEVVCWLLSNTLQQEALQASALAGQKLAHCWRAPALDTLLTTRCKQPAVSGASGIAGVVKRPALQLRMAPQTFAADLQAEKPGDQTWKHFSTLSPFAGDAAALAGVIVAVRFAVSALAAGDDGSNGDAAAAELPAYMTVRLSAYFSGEGASADYMLYHEGTVKLDASGRGSLTREVLASAAEGSEAAQVALWAARAGCADAAADARTLYVELTNPLAGSGAAIAVSATVTYLLQPPPGDEHGSADAAGADLAPDGEVESLGCVCRWSSADVPASASADGTAAPSLLAAPWRPVDVMRLQQLQVRAPDSCTAAAAAVNAPHWDPGAGAAVASSLSAALAATPVALTDGAALSAALSGLAGHSAGVSEAPANALLRMSLGAFQSRVDRSVPAVIAAPRAPAADIADSLAANSVLLGLAAADDRRLAELAVSCSSSSSAGSPSGPASPPAPAGAQAHTLDTEREVLHEELREREVQREAQAEVQRRDRDWDPRTAVWPLADALQLLDAGSGAGSGAHAAAAKAGSRASQWWLTRLCDFGWAPPASAAAASGAASGAAAGPSAHLPTPPELLASVNFARRGADPAVAALPRRLHDARVMLTLAAADADPAASMLGLLLTLREAETVRRALWGLSSAQHSGAGRRDRSAPVAIRLWLLPSGRGPVHAQDSSKLLAAFDSSARSGLSAPEAEPSSLLRLATHARFFNGCTDLAPREVLAVGCSAAVAALPLPARATLFALLVDPGRRRRDVGVWEGTPAAPLFAFASGAALRTALEDLAVLSTALRRLFGSMQDAFVALCAAEAAGDASAAGLRASPVSPGHTAAAEASAGLTLREFADRCAAAVSPLSLASGGAARGALGGAGAAPSRLVADNAQADAAVLAARRLPQHAQVLLRFQSHAGGDSEGSVVRWPDVARLFAFALDEEAEL